MSAAPKAKCCPACSGTEGYEYELRVVNIMNAGWGEEATYADSTNSTESLVRCLDCGAKFRLDALKRKELVP